MVGKALQVIAVIAIVAGIVSQFAGVEKHNRRVVASETIEAQTQMPPNVAGILRRACYDCHSEETRWYWYARVAPFSWLVTSDVYAARYNMDFSEWGRLTAAQKDDRLEGICELVKKGEMPLWYYKPMHYPDAFLSDADANALCAWTAAERTRLAQPK